jgi:hypothetical protein
MAYIRRVHALAAVADDLSESTALALRLAWETAWCEGPERARKGPARASGVPVMGRRLVELVLRDGVGIREVEGRGLIEVELGLGRAACGGTRGEGDAGGRDGGGCAPGWWAG